MNIDDITSWPGSIRMLALAIEVSQAWSWAEGVRQRDSYDRKFDQRQLD